MKLITAVMGFGLYLLALELSYAIAPRWVGVWWSLLALHGLLVLAAITWSVIAAVRRKIRAGAAGVGPGTRAAAPAETRES